MKGTWLCCVKLTVGARLIGVVGLVISVFAMKQLILELTGETTSGNIGIFLIGLHTPASSSSNASKHKVNYYLVWCFVFSIIYELASSALIWATIVEKKWCIIPWMVVESMRFFIQIGGLIYYTLTPAERRPHYKTWQLVISGISIGATLYVLAVVWFAQMTWHSTRATERAVLVEPSARLRQVPRIIIEDYDEMQKTSGSRHYHCDALTNV